MSKFTVNEKEKVQIKARLQHLNWRIASFNQYLSGYQKLANTLVQSYRLLNENNIHRLIYFEKH